MLFAWARVSREPRDDVIACDVPFDLLRMKGAFERGRKKRRVDFDDEYNEGQGSNGAGPSGPFSLIERMEAEMAAMRELENLEVEKKKWQYRDKLFVQMWKGGFENKESSEPDDYNNEATSYAAPP
ncbi:hypothetical protein HAX54_033433 [Datura stramonium]|uniref:Uncharacterized protein n=1 Tax=Datura stramonium TaxID=4076 RepID=A0ABS8VEM4_DATST|nr:hypothetical protein [Datura stramonium]